MASTNVIDISSDEEDDVVQNSPRAGQNSRQKNTNISTSSSQAVGLADGVRPTRKSSLARHQSTSNLHTQVNHELPQKRVLSELRTSSTGAVFPVKLPPSSPCNPNEGPSSGSSKSKIASIAIHIPTPLTLNSGSCPPNPVTLRPSERQSALNPKRKPTGLAESVAKKRVKPSPPPPIPNRPPGQSSAPTMSIIDVWPITQYQEPITFSDNAPEESPVTPDVKSDKTPKKPFSTGTAASTESHPATIPPSFNSPKPSSAPASPSRPRGTMWTCAQLANFATALDNALDLDAFAAANNKTSQQVKETLGFLVMRPVFEYAEEGLKVARKFHREMKEHRKETEKMMRNVHRKEAKAGHWAAEGMPANDKKEIKTKKKDVKKEKNDSKGRDEGKGKNASKGKRKEKGVRKKVILKKVLDGEKKPEN